MILWMHRVPVSSGNLAGVGYDEASSILEIAFLNGRVYQYRSVPSQVHSGLMRAGSHGSYFNAFIRPVYRGVRVV